MTNAEVLQQVDKGYRMPSPPGNPEALYAIMLDCWQQVRRNESEDEEKEEEEGKMNEK